MRTTSNLTSIGYKIESIEDIQNYAPAACTDHKSPRVSDKYSFVSTMDILQNFNKLGWHPTYARQSGKDLYARHVIRLINPNVGFINLKHDKVRPQIVLDNSHNGTSYAQIHLGLFRLICTNGLVVAMPGMLSAVHFRHMGINFDEFKNLIEIVVNQYNLIGQHVNDMQQIKLNNDQKEEFVIKAIAAREPQVFIKEDGTIDTKKVTLIINPKQIIDPIREEDNQDDLWTVFNIIQERLVKGIFDRQTLSGRKAKPRGISNVSRNINFNTKLWEIAESYMTSNQIV